MAEATTTTDLDTVALALESVNTADTLLVRVAETLKLDISLWTDFTIPEKGIPALEASFYALREILVLLKSFSTVVQHLLDANHLKGSKVIKSDDLKKAQSAIRSLLEPPSKTGASPLTTLGVGLQNALQKERVHFTGVEGNVVDGIRGTLEAAFQELRTRFEMVIALRLPQGNVSGFNIGSAGPAMDAERIDKQLTIFNLWKDMLRHITEARGILGHRDIKDHPVIESEAGKLQGFLNDIANPSNLLRKFSDKERVIGKIVTSVKSALSDDSKGKIEALMQLIFQGRNTLSLLCS